MDDESPGLENSGGEEQLGSNVFGSDGSGTNVHSFEVCAATGGVLAVLFASWLRQPPFCCPAVKRKLLCSCLQAAELFVGAHSFIIASSLQFNSTPAAPVLSCVQQLTD